MTAVLVRSARRCCLCFGLNGDFSEKKGQVAHLDRDPANHSERNLAFLCLEHHDAYDSSSSQSKGFTKEEISFYRSKLFEAVETKLPGRASGKPENGAAELRVVAKFLDEVGDNQPFRSSFLNGYEVQRAHQQELLIIDPFSPDHITGSAYRLSCGEEALVDGRLVKFSRERPLKIQNSSLVILTTEEILSVPYWLGGKLAPSVAMPRSGLFIDAFGRIDPGFRGRLFVTAQNVGPHPIAITPGTPLLSVEFCLMNVPAHSR